MKATKRAAVKSQQVKVKAPPVPKPPVMKGASKAPANTPGNQQAPATAGQMSNALAYYGAMASHGKG